MARKKEAHHGGAWKVAYADFVTAMMALFMVLWISAQDQKILIATSKYFQNPFRALREAAGIIKSPTDGSAGSPGKEQSHASDNNSQLELSYLTALARDLSHLLHVDTFTEEKPIDIQITSDGLRVVLFNRSNKPIFRDDTAEFTEWGRFLMQNLAWVIEREKFRVAIEGHTRAGIHFAEPNLNPWSLSLDRADAARRSLTYYAVAASQVDRVSGFADTRPLPGTAPDSESNQRITLSLTIAHRVPRDGGAEIAATAAGAPPGPPEAGAGRKAADGSHLQFLSTPTASR